MTQEERRLVAAVAVLVLFGSAVRWFRSQGPEPWTALELAATADSARATAEADAAPAGPARGEEKREEKREGEGQSPAPVDLNRADAALFETLPGIGKTKALAIVAWREEHGPFRSLADLEQVPGIGPKTIERLAPLVVWTEAPEGAKTAPRPAADTTSVRGNGTDHEPGHRRTAAPVGQADPRAVPEGEEAAGVHRGAGG